MKQAYVKGTNNRIVGLLESVPATAYVGGFNDDGAPYYHGGTEVHWDGQHPVERDGSFVYLDEDGEEYRESEIELRDGDEPPLEDD